MIDSIECLTDWWSKGCSPIDPTYPWQCTSRMWRNVLIKPCAPSEVLMKYQHPPNNKERSSSIIDTRMGLVLRVSAECDFSLSSLPSQLHSRPQRFPQQELAAIIKRRCILLATQDNSLKLQTEHTKIHWGAVSGLPPPKVKVNIWTPSRCTDWAS